MVEIMSNHLTSDHAVDQLMHGSLEDLRESCYYFHKDLYGTKGHHLLKYSYAELANWIVSHYSWNEDTQRWEYKNIQ